MNAASSGENPSGGRNAWPAVERGTGRPVVFLHGYPLSHVMWEALLPHLPRDCRAILLDLPGYGLAQEEPVPVTLEGFAQSVYRSLSGRVDPPSVIIGHSFGGYIALELYREHPELFAGLVLADTRSEADTQEAREKRLATIRRLEETGQPLEVEATAKGLLAPATWASGGTVPTLVKDIIRAAPPATVIASLRAIAGRPDLSPILPTISVPTVVIWGEEDGLIPPAQSRSMVPKLPKATGVGIAGAGHLPALEAPERFVEALEPVLNRTDAG
jgi:pimeloyl-ACP methyl ester carboxylesterase